MESYTEMALVNIFLTCMHSYIHPSLVIQTFALGEEISRELARLKLGEGYIKVYLRTIHLFVFK